MEGTIDEDQMNLPQPQGAPGSKKKVLTDLRVKRPNSSRIQLGISWSSLIMIWLHKWGIYCKHKIIFQSQPVRNQETVFGMLAPSDNLAIFAKEVVEHHLSFQKLIKVPVPIVQEVLSSVLNQVVFKFWRIQILWRMLKPLLCLMLLCWFSLVLG